MSTDLEPAQSIPEFAETEGVSIAHCYNEIARGRLIAVKNGRRSLILPEERARYRASLPKMISRAKVPGASRKS